MGNSKGGKSQRWDREIRAGELFLEPRQLLVVRLAEVSLAPDGRPALVGSRLDPGLDFGERQSVNEVVAALGIIRHQLPGQAGIAALSGEDNLLLDVAVLAIDGHGSIQEQHRVRLAVGALQLDVGDGSSSEIDSTLAADVEDDDGLTSEEEGIVTGLLDDVFQLSKRNRLVATDRCALSDRFRHMSPGFELLRSCQGREPFDR